MKTFDDGSKVQENLNGTVIEIALDGTRTQTNKDGTVITSYLDGSKRQQNKDGKVIEATVGRAGPDEPRRHAHRPQLQGPGLRLPRALTPAAGACALAT